MTLNIEGLETPHPKPPNPPLVLPTPEPLRGDVVEAGGCSSRALAAASVQRRRGA